MRLLSALFAGMMVGAVAMTVVAQNPPPRGGGNSPNAGGPPPSQVPPGPRGQGRAQLAPEKVKAAWELEVKHLAQGLGMNEEQTKSAVAAYIDVREKHAQAVQQLMAQMRENPADPNATDQDAQREAMQKAFEDLNKSDREKLRAELAKSMTSEQVDKAIVPLGAFNPNWDLMVSTVAGFNLDQAKNKQAMDAIQTYITEIAKSSGETEPDARRTATQQARTKLTDSVKPILSQEQFGQFERTIGGMRGGMRGPNAGGQPRGRPGAEGGRGGRGGSGTGSSGGSPQ